MDAELFQIGTVAEQVGLSLRTIRFYEEAGVAAPSARSPGGFRLYTQADIDRLIEVKAMKPLGFSLDETRQLMILRDRLREGKSLSADDRAQFLEFTDRARERYEKRKRQLSDARRLTSALESEASALGDSVTTDR